MSSKNGDVLCDGFVQSNADFVLSEVGVSSYYFKWLLF